MQSKTKRGAKIETKAACYHQPQQLSWLLLLLNLFMLLFVILGGKEGACSRPPLEMGLNPKKLPKDSVQFVSF
jgi:hypothetical protein